MSRGDGDKSEARSPQKNSSNYLLLLLTLLTGGLGGAVFTWYIQRPSPTEVVFQSAHIDLSVDGMKDFVPSLALTVDDKPIDSLVYREVSLRAISGDYRESLEVAFSLDSADDEVFFTTETPSSIYKFDCSLVGRELVCGMGPMHSGDEVDFVLRVASQTGQPLRPSTAENNAILRSALATERDKKLDDLYRIAFFSLVIAGLIGILLSKLQRSLRSEIVLKPLAEGVTYAELVKASMAERRLILSDSSENDAGDSQS